MDNSTAVSVDTKGANPFDLYSYLPFPRPSCPSLEPSSRKSLPNRPTEIGPDCHFITTRPHSGRHLCKQNPRKSSLACTYLIQLNFAQACPQRQVSQQCTACSSCCVFSSKDGDPLLQAGNITEAEMFRTFNMGVGMIIIVDIADAEKVKQLEPSAIQLGSVVAKEGVKFIE